MDRFGISTRASSSDSSAEFIDWLPDGAKNRRLSSRTARCAADDDARWMAAASGGAGTPEPEHPARLAGDLGIRLSLLMVLLVVWELTTSSPRCVFPPAIASPSNTGRLAARSRRSGGTLPSLSRLLAGWSLAVVMGIAVGTAIGMSAGSRTTSSHHAVPAVIPPPALIPLFIVLLGIGDEMKAAIIVFGVVSPILINTIDGVRSVDRCSSTPVASIASHWSTASCASSSPQPPRGSSRGSASACRSRSSSWSSPSWWQP